MGGALPRNIVAVIPARGGSKGIPRKNVRVVAGRPLIAWTIEAARQAETISRVVVSTDDPEIGAVSQEYRAEVIWRPIRLSGDDASSESALLHALDHLRQTEGNEPKLLVFLQCTAPLTLPEDIDGTVKVLSDEKADSALAVTPFRHFLWRRDPQEGSVGVNHDKSVRLLRQEREPQYQEAGAVNVMRTKGFKRAKHRFFGEIAMYVMPRERCFEIDEPVDLLVVETLLRKRQEQQRLQALPSAIAALVLDFDGVLTDNRVIVFHDGREGVQCDRGDGWGVAQLKVMNLPILVLSTEENPVVQARCDKLGIDCMQGVGNKLAALNGWLRERKMDASRVVYVGNDVNDLSCLQAVGCGIAVGDAYPEARAAARIILSAPGGRGAVREVAELIGRRLERERECRV